MSSERRVEHVWTCDACGHVETVDDNGSGRPTTDRGWRQIVVGTLYDKLGNLPSKDLCGGCANGLALLLASRLGDLGDLEQAWGDGYRVGQDAYAGLLPDDDPPTNPYCADGLAR